jgi:Brp/Blh family beta-carotene 15,15'-monooxygenase
MRNAKLQRMVQLITLVVLLGCLSNHPFISASSFLLAVSLIILIGIPHGANDHLLFFNLIQNKLMGRNNPKVLFYGTYIGLMLLYAGVWYVFPLFSLFLFLIISVYHFGQSNLYTAHVESKFFKLLSILISGIFVLMTPILAHFETALPVITTLTQNNILVDISFEQGREIAFYLGMLTLIYWTFLIITKRISGKKGIENLLNHLLLFGLFYTAPLWLGFSVYFTLWHAIPSMEDQIKFFKRSREDYHFGNYIREIIPYTILALFGLAVALKFSGQYITQNQTLALLFAFIAVITLPHMIMMELFYQQMEKKGKVLNL